MHGKIVVSAIDADAHERTLPCRMPIKYQVAAAAAAVLVLRRVVEHAITWHHVSRLIPEKRKSNKSSYATTRFTLALGARAHTHIKIES